MVYRILPEVAGSTGSAIVRDFAEPLRPGAPQLGECAMTQRGFPASASFPASEIASASAGHLPFLTLG